MIVNESNINIKPGIVLKKVRVNGVGKLKINGIRLHQHHGRL